jgi:hypothetical protein
MPIDVVVKKELVVGNPTIVEGAAREGSFMAVFEDDGETG